MKMIIQIILIVGWPQTYWNSCRWHICHIHDFTRFKHWCTHHIRICPWKCVPTTNTLISSKNCNICPEFLDFIKFLEGEPSTILLHQRYKPHHYYNKHLLAFICSITTFFYLINRQLWTLYYCKCNFQH